jgi:hypothetical protein
VFAAWENWRNKMRVFILSCIVGGMVVFAAAGILDYFVQEPVSVAFAESSARVSR